MSVHNLTDDDAIEAAGRLSDQQRLAFFLIQVRGLSFREAAKEMDTSSANVHKTYKRACRNIGFDLLKTAGN